MAEIKEEIINEYRTIDSKNSTRLHSADQHSIFAGEFNLTDQTDQTDLIGPIRLIGLIGLMPCARKLEMIFPPRFGVQ